MFMANMCETGVWTSHLCTGTTPGWSGSKSEDSDQIFVAVCKHPFGVDVVPLVKIINAMSFPSVSRQGNGFAAGISLVDSVESEVQRSEGDVVQQRRTFVSAKTD